MRQWLDPLALLRSLTADAVGSIWTGLQFFGNELRVLSHGG
jgi:hypothetical protein